MSFIHASADVQSDNIGPCTRIWQYVVILPKAIIGRDSNICSHCLIENDVVIGDRVTIKSGVQLWDGLRLGDDVFVGPNVTFSNDKFPRSRNKPDRFLTTHIESGASVGAGAVILPGIVIGMGAMVGAGAVVTRSVPPYAIVTGNPANIVGYAENKVTALNSEKSDALASLDQGGAVITVGVGQVSLRRLKVVQDMRGDLSVAEFSKDIPFTPKRYFLVLNVPSRETRGEHAHRQCHQFLICVKGSCSVVVDDGTNRQEVKLDSHGLGIHLPPMTWGIQYKYSADAVLLVFASEYYDASDYIRDYQEFCSLVRGSKNMRIW